jgi:hypothetical protein
MRRVKIPAVIMAKGYSDKQSKNGTLKMQSTGRWKKSGDWFVPECYLMLQVDVVLFRRNPDHPQATRGSRGEDSPPKVGA